MSSTPTRTEWYSGNWVSFYAWRCNCEGFVLHDKDKGKHHRCKTFRPAVKKRRKFLKGAKASDLIPKEK